jgi:hypothetical protein
LFEDMIILKLNVLSLQVRLVPKDKASGLEFDMTQTQKAELCSQLFLFEGSNVSLQLHVKLRALIDMPT